MTAICILAGVVIGFVVVLLVSRWLMIRKARMQMGQPAPELTGKLGRAIRKGGRTLFYFYSPRCGACRSMTPLVQRMQKKGQNAFAVDISSDMDTARRFGVMATPTVILVQKGTIEEVRVGPLPEATLKKMVA